MPKHVHLEDLSDEVVQALPPDVVEALDQMENHAAHLSELAMRDFLGQVDVPQLLLWLRVQRALAADLADLDATLCRHLYMVGEHQRRDYGEGVGRAWISRTREKERWDERGAVRAVIDAKMAERGYEVPDDPWEVAEWLLEAGAFARFRKTALRAMGVDIDSVYDSIPGKPSVSFDS